MVQALTPRIPAWLRCQLVILVVSMTVSCSSAPQGPTAADLQFQAPIGVQGGGEGLIQPSSASSSVAVRASFDTPPRQPERQAVPPTLAPHSEGFWKHPDRHSLGDVLGAVVPKQRLPEMLGGKLVPILNPAPKEIGLVLVWEL